MNDQLDLPLYFTFSPNLRVVMSLYGCIFGFFDRIVGSSKLHHHRIFSVLSVGCNCRMVPCNLRGQIIPADQRLGYFEEQSTKLNNFFKGCDY